MTGEVKHLANNERYRILLIDGETYIIDIERSFWKIIFPFLFWLLPNSVFLVKDQDLVERIQIEKVKKKEVSGRTSLIGVAYAGGMLLYPLLEYFHVPMPPLINLGMLGFALLFVCLLYLTFRHNRKKKLYASL